MPPVRAAPAVAMLSLVSCLARLPPSAPAAPSPADALMAADAAMSDAVASRDPERFRSSLDEDAVFGGRDGLARGRAAVGEAWAGLLAPGGPSLAWWPERGEASVSGDLGFTVGRYQLRGQAGTVEGRYLTVWRRDAAGAWRALFDHGLEAPPPAGAVRVPLAAASSREGDLEAAIGTWSAPGGGAATGTYLVVRRRGADGTWVALVEAGAAAQR